MSQRTTTSTLAIAARLPLDPSLPRETMRELAYAFIGLTGIEPDPIGEALPCRLDHGIELDETNMPRPGATPLVLRGTTLLIMGLMTDFDRPVTWEDGPARYCAGLSVMSEAFAMLTPAIAAQTGDLLGAIGRSGGMSFSGPIAMTADGLRWIPSALSANRAENGGKGLWAISRVPPRLLSKMEGGECSSHAAIDRRALRTHVRFETMKRASRPAEPKRLSA